jgi:chitinase
MPHSSGRFSRISLIILSLILFTNCTKQKETKNELNVMAYYVPSDKVKVEDLPYDKLTHILFSFTEVIEHKMAFEHEEMSQKLSNLTSVAKKHPNVKIMIACGGWGGSGGFSDMVYTKENRQIFVNSVIEFIKKYDLDGIDLDWEYPGLPGIGNTFRPEDKENFTALVKELRQALDKYEKGQIMTFAAAGWEKYFDHIELSEVMKHMDYINLMTYDMAGGSPLTTHHTNLYGIPYDELEETTREYLKAHDINYQPRSVNDITGFCLNKGVDPAQIVIGAAFYGRSWKGVPAMNNGLRQEHNNNKGAHSYTDLQQMMADDSNYKRFWDDKSSAPFIYNPLDSMFITLDDPESLALKTQFALEKGLGGIMFWQLSHDNKENDLVKAIFESKTNKP